MINILGYHYDVTGLDDSQYMGMCLPLQLRIRMQLDMPPQQQESTLLHEILEAVNSHLGLNLKHHKIVALETALYQVLTANGVSLQPLLEKAGQGEP